MSKTIVVVEDSEDDVFLTIRSFKKQGYSGEFIVFGRGEEALSYLEQTENLPILILLDINLPGGMNGIEILKNLRDSEKLKNVPVIILTTSKDEEHLVSSFHFGVSIVMQKPITDIAHILDIIEQYDLEMDKKLEEHHLRLIRKHRLIRGEKT